MIKTAVNFFPNSEVIPDVVVEKNMPELQEDCTAMLASWDAMKAEATRIDQMMQQRVSDAKTRGEEMQQQ
eukprot:COSAG04_NODE_12121_length_669_cov_1.110526_1_plen_69_part_10